MTQQVRGSYGEDSRQRCTTGAHTYASSCTALNMHASNSLQTPFPATAAHLDEGVVDRHHPHILAVKCGTQHKAANAAKACKTAAGYSKATDRWVQVYTGHVSTGAGGRG
jgi:hypothetical protein